MVLSRIENTSVRDWSWYWFRVQKWYFVRSVGVRGCSLFPRSLNYRLVVLLLRITVVTCDRTGTIVDIRKDAGGYPNASHARRLNRLGSQFSVFYSSNVYGWLFLRAVDARIDSVGVDYCFSSYRLIQWMDRSLLHKCSLTLQVLRSFVQFNSSSLIIIY